MSREQSVRKRAAGTAILRLRWSEAPVGIEPTNRGFAVSVKRFRPVALGPTSSGLWVNDEDAFASGCVWLRPFEAICVQNVSSSRGVKTATPTAPRYDPA